MISQIDLDDFNRSCLVFNDIAGKSTKTDIKSLIEQYDLIVEELKELGVALKENNPEEVLDGAVDVLVTTLGFTQRLVNRNFDVSKALHKTAQNNLSKFVPDIDTAMKTVKYYQDQGILTRVYLDPVHNMFAILDMNNKVRKPLGYTANDLDDCIPVDVKENGL